MPDASRYHRLRLVLAAAGLALSIVYLVALLLTGAAHALARAAAAATGSAWGQVAIVAGVLGAARAPRRRPGGRRVDRRPVAEEPHRERGGGRARPHAAHRALRHAHRPVHAR